MPEIEGDLVQVTIDMPDGTPFSRTCSLHQLQVGVDTAQSQLDREWASQIVITEDYNGGLINGSSIVASNSQVQAWIGLVRRKIDPKLTHQRYSERIRELVGPSKMKRSHSISPKMTKRAAFASRSAIPIWSDCVRPPICSRKACYHAAAYDIGDNLTAAADELRIELKPAQSLGVTLSDV